MSGSIRRAERADLASLQPIERASSVLFPAGRIPDVDDVMPMHELERALESGSLLVATSQGSVVGFAMARELDDNFHLTVMAVRPDHGKRGFGRQLVLAIIDEATQRQHSGVTLTTFDDLLWNGPFYRSVGFRVLRDEQLSPTLRDILANEARLGMVNRVAMCCAIAG
jgi:GNAT superfamily N-acetyltransferase